MTSWDSMYVVARHNLGHDMQIWLAQINYCGVCPTKAILFMQHFHVVTGDVTSIFTVCSG